MAKRRKEAPYKELGDLITRWRSKQAASALALYKEHSKPFSFSYSTYADFERGVSLPSIEQALEIAVVFNESRDAMAMMWAQVQMPVDLKRFFSPHPTQGVILPSGDESRAATVASRIDSTRTNFDADKAVLPLSLENTWILGPQEKEMMVNHPWVIDVFLMLAINYPDPVPLETLGGDTTREIIKPCLDQGRIVESSLGLKLHEPYFYLPRNEAWQKIRQQNLLRAATKMMDGISSLQLDEGIAFQDVVTRKLTIVEAKALVKHLEQIKDTFFKTPPHGQRQVFSFAAVLAPRKLQAK